MNEFEDLHSRSVEVSLASPWRRIGAVLLNGVFNLIAYAPLIAAFVMGGSDYAAYVSGDVADSPVNTTWILVGIGVLVAYGIVQIYFMSRDGQSLGKKVLGIRVLKTDGRNPGFFGTVFLREVVYVVLLGAVAAALGYLAQMALGSEEMFELVSNLVQVAASVASVVMLFMVKIDRRTLADFLANTVVVRLPK